MVSPKPGYASRQGGTATHFPCGHSRDYAWKVGDGQVRCARCRSAIAKASYHKHKKLKRPKETRLKDNIYTRRWKYKCLVLSTILAMRKDVECLDSVQLQKLAA